MTLPRAHNSPRFATSGTVKVKDGNSEEHTEVFNYLATCLVVCY